MATKSGTVAERVTWMTRTSDVLGSHIKTDLESYLTLIRRKIQEKCATTAELIAQIRRFKIGESAHVTPNEFRFTLIKFGIILPQVLVDRIFNVFDSDRSGTMDFDEFATWIMNSEFRPALTGPAAAIAAAMETPVQGLQKKLKACIDAHPRAFRDLKEQVSFLEFISEVNRAGMQLSEREARNIFQILDPKDDGFVESMSFTIWATTGRVERYNSKARREEEGLAALPDGDAGLRRLVNKVIGHNTRQLENAFSHIKMGAGTKLPFEEFRRCLLNGGVGKNLYDMKQLFLVLGGRKEGLADVDKLFANLDSVLVDEVSAKRAPTAEISTARADRHLRDALRKCFKEVKQEIEAEDRGSSGFITPEALYRILVKRCMPLSFEDFRFVVQQIKKEPGSNRLDYAHFLHGYNPSLSHHQLNGLSTLKSYSTLPLRMSSKGPEVQDDSHLGLVSGNQSMSSLMSTGNLDPVSNPNPELRKIWQGVLRECHRVDPERTGAVSRTAFIGALTTMGMSAEAVNRLADTYTMSSGLVNYLLLFRSYLSTQRSSTANASGSVNLSASLPRLPSLPALPLNTLSQSAGPVHPWEFGYTRERHQDPYWTSATSLPKGVELKMSIPSAMEKTAEQLNPQEKHMLLAQYNALCLSVCHKCYGLFLPVWRVLRAAFKKAQGSQKGSILTASFLSILEAQGIILTKAELGIIVKNFRGYGTADLVRFDDFLRVCMLVKDHK